MNEPQFVVIDDDSAYGPFTREELRYWMLDDLAENLTGAEYEDLKRLSDDALAEHYTDADMCIVALCDPSPEWRSQTAEAIAYDKEQTNG